MGKAWFAFFMLWAVLAVATFAFAPAMGYWFPGDGYAKSEIGQEIDSLFYLILGITGVTFVGVHIALGYVLWTAAEAEQKGRPVIFSHGSHALEVIWTLVPAIVLLFIALYQMDVWAKFRIRSNYPEKMEAVAEVTARQFEWRIRYPAKGKKLQPKPQPDDLYTVNDLRVPVGRPVVISLRTEDVQHAFFVPELRVKQDAVPSLVIPVWFKVLEAGRFDMICAELCGWGHYKMKAQVLAQSAEEFDLWKSRLTDDQFDDGVAPAVGAPVETVSR